MTTSFPPALLGGRQRIKLFLALSRTPHGVIDMAAPALAALLSLGHFPSLPVTLAGLITVFAGYTAVYALNDLVDLRVDRQKAQSGLLKETPHDIDGLMVRHPLAKGALSLAAGLTWAGVWAAIAMAGAYWLNPVCLLIFISGCLLEALYCKLWQVTPLRSVVNGAVKTLGPIAAVFAVNPSPPPLFMAVLFLWFFTWEIGGQNIPNDWTDMEEDRRFNAKTIPVQWGPRRAATLIATCLAATLMLSLMALWVSPLFFGLIFMLITVAINGVLLLYPAFLLGERQQQHHAMALFNKASYYPLAMLAVVLVRFALP